MELSPSVADEASSNSANISQNIWVLPLVQILFTFLFTFTLFPGNISSILTGLPAILVLFLLYIAPTLAVPICILAIGYLADVYGRKRVLLICEVFLAVIVCVIYVSGLLQVQLGLLTYFYELFGQAIYLGIFVILQVLASDASGNQSRTRILGILLALSGNTLLASFVVLNYFGTLFLYGRSIFFVVAAFGAAIYLTKTKMPNSHSMDTDPHPARRVRIIQFIQTVFRLQNVLIFILVLAQAIFLAALAGNISPLKLSRTGQWYGPQELIPYVVVLVVQVALIGRLSHWLGNRKLVYLGLTLVVSGCILLALTPTQPTPDYDKAQMIQRFTIPDFQHRDGNSTWVPLPANENNGWTALTWFYIALFVVSFGASLITPPLFSLLTQQNLSSNWGKLLGIGAILTFLVPRYVQRPVMGQSVMDNPALPFVISAGLMAILLMSAFLGLRNAKATYPQRMDTLLS